jgi:hypothetical protein
VTDCIERVRPILAIAAALCLGLSGCAASRPAVMPGEDVIDAMPLTPDTSPIGLRRSLVADQYFWLRAKVLEGEAPAPFGEALAAMRDLRADLSADPTAWEDLEVPLGTVRRASELTAAYAELPTTRDVAGKPVQLRARALRLARAISASCSRPRTSRCGSSRRSRRSSAPSRPTWPCRA